MKQFVSTPWLASQEANRLDAEVDQRLRAGITPPPEPLPWLHASIMNDVRQEAAARPAVPRWRLVWALPVVVATLLVGWFLLRPAGPETGTLAGGNSPASQLSDVAWQGAALAVQPMDDELTNLTRDLKRTQEFLLASVP